MATHNQGHGVSFDNCPECGGQYGQHGMARHRSTAHGVKPASTKKPKPLLIGEAHLLRAAIAGELTAERVAQMPSAAAKLTKLGLIDGLAATDAGRARLAPKN